MQPIAPKLERIRPINYSSAELEEEELRARPSEPRRWLLALRPERLGAELERDDFVAVDLRVFIRPPWLHFRLANSVPGIYECSDSAGRL